MLDPDYLALGLDQARADRAEADRLRHHRLATIDGQIAEQRRRLDGIASGLVDALAAGGESAAAIRRQADKAESLIVRLGHEREALDRIAADGLTDDEAAEIAAFAAEARRGIACAEPADQRALYELLRLRGTVVTDAEGVRFGRKHRYQVEWDGAIPLCNTSMTFRKTAKA